MRPKLLLLLVIGSATILAACAPEATPPPTASATAQATSATLTPTASLTPLVSPVSENFRFLISDEENVIGEFGSLNVTIDQIGILGGESGGWVKLKPLTPQVNLKELQGEDAQAIWSGTLDEGHYTKVFVFISEVRGVLLTGETVEVKLPSQKLQINQSFDITPDSGVSFVYDLTVVAAGNEKSGIKYILKPQVGGSGAGRPYAEVKPKGEKTPRQHMGLFVEGRMIPDENVTVRVTRERAAVQGATVTVNGEVVGSTNQEGVLSFRVPQAEKWEIEARAILDGDSVEGEIEFDSVVEEETPETPDPSATPA
ncbi:MAG: FAD/FMN-dependent dehydrogenase [Dehalococcoidia bacterium]|nr:FAD/FMN-dependent dehydrogenase [Dehalococcoidia bacterium]